MISNSFYTYENCRAASKNTEEKHITLIRRILIDN